MVSPLEKMQQAERAVGAPVVSPPGLRGSGAEPVPSSILNKLEEAEVRARPPQPGGGGVPGLLQRGEQARAKVEAGGTLPGSQPSLQDIQPRDLRGPHIPLPPELSGVADFLTGTNRTIAWVLDAPINTVQQALTQIGALASDTDPAEAPDIVKSTFEALGIDTSPIDSLAAEMGEEVVYGGIVGAGIILAAPSLAAASGANVGSQFLRDMGRFAQNFPGVELAAGAGGGVGVPVAVEHLGETIGDAPAALVGGMAGGMAGGGAVGAAQGVGRAARAADRFFGERLANTWETISGRPRPLAGPGSPIRNPELETERMVDFAEATLTVDREAIENELQSALRRVSPVANTGELSASFRKELVAVQQRAEARETELWEAIPGDIEVNLGPAMREVRGIAREFRAIPGEEEVPDRFMSAIQRLQSRAQDPEADFQPTLDDVRKLRSAINRAARKEAAGDAPNQVLLRNLSRMRDGLLSSMETALDNAAEGDAQLLTNAREWSRYVNDLFSRGPIGKVTQRSRSGGETVDPTETVQALMRRLQGPMQVRRVSEELNEPRLMARMRTAVEGMFRDAIEAGQAARLGRPEEEGRRAGAQAAGSFLRRNRQLIDSISGVGLKLQSALENANFQITRRKELENSALARWANTTPERAADELLGGRVSRRQVEELVKQTDRDPTGIARDALKNSIIGGLFRRAGTETRSVGSAFGEGRITTLNPTRAARLLQDSGVREVFQTVLEGNEFSRLSRLVNIASRVEAGEERLMRQLARGTTSVMARIFGAQVGRSIAQVTGGGTVQTPGITSGVMRSLVDRAFIGSDPGELLARAVTDPQWERVLMSRAPRTVSDGRRFVRRMERVVGAMEAGRQQALGKVEFREEDDGEREQ